MTELHYKITESGQLLILTESVLNHLHEHRQVKASQSEAGGQLFAKFDSEIIRITLATGPRRSDKRSVFGFVPNRLAERREIKARFRQGLHFVGDWHTHPQSVPMPSTTDVESITDTFRQSRHGLAGFVMIILGTCSAPKGLYVAVCDSQGCVELQPVNGLTFKAENVIHGS